MSYSKCYICGDENYSGNENRVTIESVKLDKERGASEVVMRERHVCDRCFDELLRVFDKELGK